MEKRIKIMWTSIFLLAGICLFLHTEFMINLLFKSVGLLIGISAIAVLIKDLVNKIINLINRK